MEKHYLAKASNYDFRYVYNLMLIASGKWDRKRTKSRTKAVAKRIGIRYVKRKMQ